MTGVIVVVAVLGASAQTSEVSAAAIVDGLPNITDFLGRMFPPDLSGLGTAIDLMWETLGIAVIGTAVGVALAIPLALPAARTVFPSHWVRQPTRLFVDVLRAVPEPMWPCCSSRRWASARWPGRSRSSSRPRPVSRACSPTSSRPPTCARGRRRRRPAPAGCKRISWVLLPQQVPTMTSYSLLILDSNVRAASLLGLVGAGGIGAELTNQLRLFEYGKVLTIVLIVLVVVVALDQASSWLRRRLV